MSKQQYVNNSCFQFSTIQGPIDFSNYFSTILFLTRNIPGNTTLNMKTHPEESIDHFLK